MTDKNTEIAKYHGAIENCIGLGPGSVIFDPEEVGEGLERGVTTVNPQQPQSFLCYQTTGKDNLGAMCDLTDYVKYYKEKESSYTFQWPINGEKHLNTSYFSAKNMLESLDKLFFGRDANPIKVFSVLLNPMTQ